MEATTMTSNSQRVVFLLVSFLLAGFTLHAEPESGDLFSHEQEILIPAGHHEYYSVELSALQYRNAQRDLGDLRVRDSLGIYCPYVLNSSRNEETSEQISYTTVSIGMVEESVDEVSMIHHDVQVVDFPDDGEVNTIVLETDKSDFSCQVRVFARTAKSDWRPIATDTVYRLDDAVKLFVEMDDVPLYQFWRITVDAPSPFESVAVVPRLDRKRSESQGFLKEMPLEFDITERNRNGRTVISVNNPDRLHLVALALETDALFKRIVVIQSDRSRVFSKQLYRIPSGGSLAIDTVIQIPGSELRDESFELIIENRDDEPLPIEKITAQYQVDYLVFKPSGHPPYVLVYGNALLEKPRYDLASYRDEVLATNPALSSLAKPVIHAVPEVDKNSGKTIFTVIVIASAAVLFALSLMIFIKKPGSQP